MRGTSSWWISILATLAGACGAGDTRLDPGDLELRDLLGIAPEAAIDWDVDQRAAARRVLAGGLRDPVEPVRASLDGGRMLDERIARSIAVIDGARASDGADAFGVVRVAIGPSDMTVVGIAAPAVLPADGVVPPSRAVLGEVSLAERWQTEQAWGHLPGRGFDLLDALAREAGHAAGPLVVAPAPRLPAIAAYVPGEPARLIVNPVVLAALDPRSDDGATLVAVDHAAGVETAPGSAVAIDPATSIDPTRGTGTAAAPGGNPYSFYGSIAECAFAQRSRCETCLSMQTCDPITNTTDGNAECTMLGAANGRGYFLLCINLALAISSVDQCTADGAPQCPRDVDAASTLAELENNAHFLDDVACGTPLDTCLAEIYGAPPDEFPGLDGGVAPPRPPRDTSVSCNDSCESDNCEASPSCDCSGPSCNNSFSCDSACSSSNDQSGCGGNCDACESDSGGGGGGCSSDSGGSSSGGGCGGDSSSGGDSCGGGCGGDSGGGGCGGDSGGGCGGDSGGCGGGGGCGDSGGGCSGGGGGGCSGGGGGGSCQVAKKNPSAGAAIIISLAWAFLPVPFAVMLRRRARKRSDAPPDPPPEPVPPADANDDSASRADQEAP